MLTTSGWIAPAATTLLAFVVAAIGTPVAGRFARRIGAVAAPKADRWHSEPTPLLGGLAIYVAVMAALFTIVPPTPRSWVVIAASSALFVLGLVDDFLHLKPYQKLAGQLLAAAAVVYLGLVLPWTGSFPINMLITFVWLVGVTNAVNMLDNMDGLAAGIAAIAALSLAVTFLLNGKTIEALMLLAFFGALAGFLLYNHHPASIFMGDGGSMFIGFFLASTALLAGQAGGGRSRSVLAVLAVPILVLCIPIFDTTFVTLMRKLAGRAASQGGRDHTSHRLVALGMSERNAVWMLWAFAALGGALAIAVRKLPLDLSLAASGGFVLMLGVLGAYLGGVHVYSEEELAAARRKPLAAFLVDLSYKRRMFELGLDLMLIVFSFYLAHAAVLGPASPRMRWQPFLETLPMVVFIKLAVFLAAGMYRGMWRYASVSDASVFARNVLIASIATIATLQLTGAYPSPPRTLFIIDGFLLLILVNGSRFGFRLLPSILGPADSGSGRRVVIVGAGDKAELLYRDLRAVQSPRYRPVAFIDDDTTKSGRRLHGVKIFDGTAVAIEDLCRTLKVEEVFLSADRLPVARAVELIERCDAIGIPVNRLRHHIEPVSASELAYVGETVPAPRLTIAAPPPPESPAVLPAALREVEPQATIKRNKP
jgi:UDP-GlcNAc:undecaprenyl-phosphate GlcNAc-1-phosphate transferase